MFRLCRKNIDNVKKGFEFMRMNDGGAVTLIIILSIAAIAGLVSQRWLGEDNPVEEKAEEVIEHYTGFDVDLSPHSDELL